MLNDGGRLVLSIDKNQNTTICCGTREITVFPDNRETIVEYLEQADIKILTQYETAFAYIFVANNIL